MKPGLLERIQAVGHWRVVLRPLVPVSERLLLQRCFDEVERARVSLRGWDYPHVSHRDDDQGGAERSADYIENWTDWHTQVEFWRMYRSGQFVSYASLWEDLNGEPRKPQGRVLDVVDAIYSVTEFAEFATRLHTGGLYPEGLSIRVTLGNAADRQLWAGRRRVPFFNRRVTRADHVNIERRVDPDRLRDGGGPLALEMLLELFDHFGWAPEPNQIRADQEAFFRREI